MTPIDPTTINLAPFALLGVGTVLAAVVYILLRPWLIERITRRKAK